MICDYNRCAVVWYWF